jgi:hypothetical protein
LRADRIRFVHSALFGLSKSCEGGDMFVWIERHLAATAARIIALKATVGRAVDLLLPALRFRLSRRGLIQVYRATHRNQIGHQQDPMTMFFMPRGWRESVDEGLPAHVGRARAISRH